MRPAGAHRPTPRNGSTHTPAVQATGLVKTYAGRRVVDEVDLAVLPGTVHAVLGPNGAGKTTTLEILEGYRRPDAGDVLVLGTDPSTADRSWRARVGVVLQSSSIPAELTVGELVDRYAGYYPHPHDVDETLELVGLLDQRSVRAGRLSGGMLRKLDVAMAVVGNPELLFLDEPTTGLDPTARRDAWVMLAALRDRGTTIVLTTHYLEEAEVLADMVTVLVEWRVVAGGTPQELAHSRGGLTTIRFATPDDAGTDELARLPHVLSVRHEGPLTVLAADAAGPAVLALAGWAGAHHSQLPDLEVLPPSLEDAYLSLTGGSS